MKRLLLVLTFLLIASNAFALPGVKSTSVSWNANTEADLAGYKLYWRSVGGAFTDANSVTILAPATVKIISGVVPNKSELALTAYDTSGNESGFSAIIFFDRDSVAPSIPSGVQLSPQP